MKVAFAACMCLGLAAMASPPQDVRVGEWVVTNEATYCVLPPEALAVRGAKRIEWSPSGRFLLIFFEGPPLTPSVAVDLLLGKKVDDKGLFLTVWDKSNKSFRNYGRSEWLVSSDLSGGILWIDGSDECWMTLGNLEDALTPLNGTVLRRLDFTTGRTRELPVIGATTPAGSIHNLDRSPAVPCFFLLQWAGKAPSKAEDSPKPIFLDHQAFLWTLDDQGKESSILPLEEGSWGFSGWVGDGSIVQLIHRFGERNEKGSRQSRMVYYDCRSRQFVNPPQPVREYVPKVVIKPIVVRMTKNETRAGTVRVTHNAVWLAASVPSNDPPVLLSGDADSASLCPTLDLVAVLERGIVTVRPLAVLPRATWDEAYRRMAMDGAKQVAIGLMIYSADYDDLMPEMEHFQHGEVGPYLKSAEWLSRFTLKLGGANVSKIENPAITVLGYIPGPGGFAVAFADGHVEWRTRLP